MMADIAITVEQSKLPAGHWTALRSKQVQEPLSRYPTLTVIDNGAVWPNAAPTMLCSQGMTTSSLNLEPAAISIEEKNALKEG